MSYLFTGLAGCLVDPGITSVTPAPAVSYLFTGLAGCSVDPGISCGAYKLARTPRLSKKKKIKLKNQLIRFHSPLFTHQKCCLQSPFSTLLAGFACYWDPERSWRDEDLLVFYVSSLVCVFFVSSGMWTICFHKHDFNHTSRLRLFFEVVKEWSFGYVCLYP